jgi:predicted PurR-regulated permease PerM
MPDDDSASDTSNDDSAPRDHDGDETPSVDGPVDASPTADRPERQREANGAASGIVEKIADGPLGLEVDRGRIGLWLAAVVMFAAVAYVTWRYVGTVVVGLFAYYVTRPLFDRIHGRIESRTAAVAVSLVTVAFPVLVLVGWTLYVAVRSLADVIVSDLGDQVAAFLQPYADLSTTAVEVTEAAQVFVEDPTRLTELELGSVASQSFSLLATVVGELFAVGIHAFVVLILVFYLLRDDYRLAEWARRTFVTPDGVVDRYLVAVDRDLKNVFFGNILNALLTGFLAVVTYLLLNTVAPATVHIPEPALVGLLVGAASLVPVIGIKLVTVPVAIYLFARAAMVSPETLWFPVLFLAVSFVVVDYIPDQLLRPYVSGRTLHIGAVMLAYTLGPLLFGWYGIFLGPLILVVVFEFARIVVPWLADPESVRDARDGSATAQPPETGALATSERAASAVEPTVREPPRPAEPGTPEDSPEGGGP